MPTRILAVLGRPPAAAACLAVAGQAAAFFSAARLDVLHVRIDPERAIMPSEEVLTEHHRAEIEAREAAQAQALKQVFDDWVRHARSEAPKARWIDTVGEVEREVGRRARTAALVVLAQASDLHSLAEREAIRAALFDEHRPILIVPEAWNGTLGRHVVIAWKPSPEAGRAVAAARPILKNAGRMTVLTAPENGRAETEGLAAALEGAGPALTTHRFDPGEEPIGAALLREAHAAGADLLVMGGYSHSRLYEFILGGATRHVLSHADLPVLMAH